MSRTALYRHYDAEGALLYVGITCDPDRRAGEHSASSDWFATVRTSSISWHEDRDAALRAEARAISTENPRFNNQCTVGGPAIGEEPARTIIDLCGGIEAVAEMTGRDRIRVYRWTYPKSRGGTGGKIPASLWNRLLSKARESGIALTPDHFFGVHSASSATAAPTSEAAS